MEDSPESEDSILLYCNDLATRIFKKVIINDQIDTKMEKLIDLSTKFFYEYRTITQNVVPNDFSN